MDIPKMMDNIDTNLGKIKYQINEKQKFLEDDKRQELARYLFPSIIKNLTEIACAIQEKENWRSAINPADIFILMADNDIIHHHIVPNLKHAVKLASRIQNTQKEQLYGELKEIIKAIGMCNDAFKVYFQFSEDNK